MRSRAYSLALPLALAMAASPAWAIFKCTVDGKTSFQEQPCSDARGQTAIKALYEAPRLGGPTANGAPTAAVAPAPVAPAKPSETLEQERLRHEAEYALRDKKVEFNNFQQRCTREVDAIAARRQGFNDNVAGAMRAQAEASAATARATTCNTQVQSLQSQVDALQRKCDALGCKAPL